MGMVSFKVLFPELARRELRFAHLTREAEPGEPGQGLPPDDYAFTELYCVEPDCNCRRVILNVIGVNAKKLLAVISYGFDRSEPDCGPFLDPLNEQSGQAQGLLELAQDVVLQDADYVKRLERHYQLVKAALVDPEHPIHRRLPPGPSPDVERLQSAASFVRTAAKIGRNDPCYCNSGKKFKRCCLLAPTTSWKA